MIKAQWSALAVAGSLAMAGPAHGAVQYDFDVTSIYAYTPGNPQNQIPLPDKLKNAYATAQIIITNDIFAKGLNISLSDVASSDTWADAGVLGINISAGAGNPQTLQNLSSFTTKPPCSFDPFRDCIRYWSVQLSSLPGHGINGRVFWADVSNSYYLYLLGDTAELQFQSDGNMYTGVAFVGDIDTRHVPEPSGIALLALPMLWLGLHLRRRRVTECAA